MNRIAVTSRFKDIISLSAILTGIFSSTVRGALGRIGSNYESLNTILLGEFQGGLLIGPP